MKRTLSIFIYQCIIWLLFMLFANPFTTLIRPAGVISLFLDAAITLVAMAICSIVFTISVLVYYGISIKVFSIELSSIKNVLAQIGLTLCFDLLIACTVIVFLSSTKSRSSGFMDFTGVMESIFAIYNAVIFSFITIVIAVLGAVKRKASPRVYKIVVFCTVFLLIIYPAINHGRGIWENLQHESEYEQEQNEAEDGLAEMLAAKDAALPYNTSVIHSDPGLMDTGYKTNMVFIDYDSKKIGFLYGSPYGDFQSFPLTEGSLETMGYTLQKQWNLEAPGKKLTTYYANERNSHRTIGIQLEMADRSVYSVGDLRSGGKDDGYSSLDISSYGCFLDIDTDG